jgi:hypothetical protein
MYSKRIKTPWCLVRANRNRASSIFLKSGFGISRGRPWPSFKGHKVGNQAEWSGATWVSAYVHFGNHEIQRGMLGCHSSECSRTLPRSWKSTRVQLNWILRQQTRQFKVESRLVEAGPESAWLKSVLTASLPSALLPYIVVACTVKQHWHPLFVVVECGHSLFNLFAITDERVRVNERIEISW